MHNSNSPLCKTCLQSKCLINKHCSQKWKSVLDSRKLFILYKKGQSVFREGNMVTGVSFIFDGSVKVFNTAENGKQNIFRIATAGEMLGIRSFAEKIYLVSAAALENAAFCFFELELFLETLKENHKFALHLLEFYAQQLSCMEIQYRNFNQFCVQARIAMVLLILKDKFGKSSGEDRFLLDILLTRQEMADMAATSAGEMSRTLAFFEKEQIIILNKRKITISKHDKLDKFILEKCVKKIKRA